MYMHCLSVSLLPKESDFVCRIVQYVGPLDQRRSDTGEKLLLSNPDWRKLSSFLPEWPPQSYAQWKADNASSRPVSRPDATDIAQLRVELVAISNSRRDSFASL
jgi:hypothetical protein